MASANSMYSCPIVSRCPS